MTWNEAKIKVIHNGLLVKRQPWELTKVGYDPTRGTLFCEYEDRERRKFIPNGEELAATDWVLA